MWADFHQPTTCTTFNKEIEFSVSKASASHKAKKKKKNLSEESSVLHDFIQQTLCDRRQSSQTQKNAALAISSLYIPLSIAILLGNSAILIALKKERTLHPPSKLLVFNLVSTDLGIGIIVQPLCILYFMSIAYKRWEICRLTEMFSYMATFILCGVSFDSHCHKCGQTTCPIEKDAIQTNCYCEARPSYFAAVLDWERLHQLHVCVEHRHFLFS